jgi:hypothetical protein
MAVSLCVLLFHLTIQELVLLFESWKMMDKQVKRCTEHVWHLCCFQLDRSAGVEHCPELGHQFRFQDTEVLAKRLDYIGQLVKELKEMWLLLENFNK